MLPPWIEPAPAIGLSELQSVRPAVQEIRAAASIDINCDGRLDFVGQVRRVSGSSVLRLLALERRSDNTWRTLLDTESNVAGPEVARLAADVNNDGLRDLVTVGYDEGGLTPRIFLRAESTFRESPLSAAYLIRFESEWSRACLTSVLPRFASGAGLVLTRETIPRTSAVGHGTLCDLPVDTIKLGGRGPQ
ncbi:MAG: VCBS repeat-containing protein [Gemmatimonadetes bacterium]|nr:VCBS repeat-containing protein [Gemmatimonadota bacterium]